MTTNQEILAHAKAIFDNVNRRRPGSMSFESAVAQAEMSARVIARIEATAGDPEVERLQTQIAILNNKTRQQPGDRARIEQLTAQLNDLWRVAA